MEFKNEKKEELKIEDVKKVFNQVSEKQYSKVLKFLKKQIDKSNKTQSGGNRPPPAFEYSRNINFDDFFTPFIQNISNNENNGPTFNTEENEQVNDNQGIVSNVVTYGGYTLFQIRVILIAIFCVIYGILEEFNRLRVPYSIDPDLERVRQPATPPPGWTPNGGSKNKKKRQTKKKRVTKKNKRKTKSKKKLKR